MDYSHIYSQLIERARGRKRPECYVERHHVLPRCLGGLNAKFNLVYLTAREHLLAHMLLDRIYPNNRKIFFALWSMLTMKHNGMQRIQNSREYEKAKIRLRGQMSQIQKGSKKPRTPEHQAKITAAQVGKVLSDETKEKIRSARKLQKPWSEEQRLRQSERGTGAGNNFYGKKHSIESKARISESNASSKKVSCDGVVYNSMADAAKAFGFERYETVKKRCLSEKYPDWSLI